MSFSLTILGTASAIPTATRYPTAQLLNIDEQLFLIDCGEGTQMQLRKAKIRFHRIEHIFISHLHGDHYFGLFGLLFTMHVLRRTKPLHIYGPSELQMIMDLQMKFSVNGSHIRLNYPVIIHPINFKISEIIYEDKKLTVETITLEHSIPCCGFLFREKQKERKMIKEMIEKEQIPFTEIRKIKKGADFITKDGRVIKNEELTIPPPLPRSYVYCSDTSFNERIISQIQGVDLLYHETTFMQKHEEEAKIALHSTTLQAGTLAKQADVKYLLIGHFSQRYKNLTHLLEETKTVFERTFLAEEGKIFELNENKELLIKKTF